ncbi:MAG: hypothetical protein EHM45_14800 [Desulfobacteraceae bacterium]|nr:MAG: hypothetical protein EHM45_14800 [Desulfobacteraceae bacterium]
MTEEEFHACIDPWRDPRIWSKKKNGEWTLLDSVLNHRNEAGIDEVRLKKIEECRFIVTPSREPDAPENEYILMGRGYIDKYNSRAIDDNPEEKDS